MRYFYYGLKIVIYLFFKNISYMIDGNIYDLYEIYNNIIMRFLYRRDIFINLLK